MKIMEKKQRILKKVAWLKSQLRLAKGMLRKAKESQKEERIQLARVELKRVKRMRTAYIRLGWWQNVKRV